MEDGNATLRQGGGDLVAYPHHVAGIVVGAEAAGGGVFLSGGHGVGFAAVAVDDEYLRAVIGELGGKAAVGEGIGIQLCTGGVFQIYAVDHGIPLGGGRSGGLSGDTVVGKSQAVGEGGICGGGGRIR